MSRFLLLFNAPEPMTEFMARSTPEERQVGLEAWKQWKVDAEKAIIFEFGAAITAVGHIQGSQVSESSNQAANYAFAEADEKNSLIKVLQDHPHLQRAGATIGILEVLSMPSQ
ncbi:MAG: hypothetical protein NVS1B7_0190 [Candidatus Saccharimonadales bacterium]